MSKLHEALACLRPKDFTDVPLDELNVFLRDVFAQAELIANSVPLPPGDNGSLSSHPKSPPNSATRASELTISSASPPPPDPAHAELRKAWGKPLKTPNALGISVYKMAGNDRHGAWFARHSIHEGLGFSKWKRAMQAEFPESLAVQGKPGEGSVRGIGGDRRLERRVVEGVGTMEVYQLAAQFPGPTAPREFITLLLTSDCALSDKSAPGAKSIPRHYMMVSVPVKHPDAPPRAGLVLGQYESVELIREIPLVPHKSASTTNLLKQRQATSPSRHRGTTISFAESRGPEAKGERLDRGEGFGEDPETNPVEWIMITRSDPGGGIPRFMVERGTPSSIVADAGKFLDWACSKDEFISDEESEEVARRASIAPQTNGYLAGIESDRPDMSLTGQYEPAPPGEGGIISSITNAVESGITAYAPAVVSENLSFLHDQQDTKQVESDDETDTSSLDSFASAEQFNTAEERPPSDSRDGLGASSSSISLAPSLGSATPGQTRHEKELAKLEAKKRQLDERLVKSREKETSDSRKAEEKAERERKKQEEKYQKEIQKLQERKEREARKIAEKQRKQADKDALTKTQRERDEYKGQVDVLRKENEILRGQVSELQRENTALAARMGKMEAGQAALRAVRDEVKKEGRKRGSSLGSQRSGRS